MLHLCFTPASPVWICVTAVILFHLHIFIYTRALLVPWYAMNPYDTFFVLFFFSHNMCLWTSPKNSAYGVFVGLFLGTDDDIFTRGIH